MSESSRIEQAGGVDRRGFLRGFGLGAAGAGAAAALVAGHASAEAADEVTVKAAKTGYRKTEHVRRYYDLARF
ncbi:hypothetical protein C882_0329 [Caenispirillum salinarum AK4]|uniref:Formate dehydrogenase subunit or accessory protein n=1 Tax=Caenispirillum salinarum AK4 TaxID=1238182 RepID=K9GW81_9PROT|nr:hypothetical protein [Caenispirillum salinarum]EKV29507.1 hypothetical protein C882_0329 [Caenispirillum salinarum AK4]